ncbi:MAG: D-amino acid aminotransferase [Chromatiales bacterium 21-64-14]|nr:MAG: D-amino acid aminotransferase [Chromatiales bacterium 21-64-14]HQU15245.1 D-amino acid aminotransferase [Gammaproteobacteria bacterium]
MSIAYLNGRFLPLEEARVPVMDRGFLFGDGVYEVIPAYGPGLFRLDEHLARLEASLAGIRIANPHPRDQWAAILQQLLEANGTGDRSVYLQVTRGAAPKRDHAFPAAVTPTVFASVSPIGPPPPALATEGVAAVTREDTRWKYCHIKAITLLANLLLRQEAIDAGCAEAILIRDGEATEGAASNLFLVRDGVLLTPPKGPFLLPGITRDLILELAREHGIAARETPIPAPWLENAEELWITSSTREILPVTRLDGRAVGTGHPGPQWARMHALFQDYKAHLRAG